MEQVVKISWFTLEYLGNHDFITVLLSETFEDKNIYEYDRMERIYSDLVRKYMEKYNGCPLCVVHVNNMGLYYRLSDVGLVSRREILDRYYDPVWQLYLVGASCDEIREIDNYVFEVVKQFFEQHGRLPTIPEFNKLVE